MSDKELLVDQATVRRLFNYDPDTGIFTRRVGNQKSKAGTVVGHGCQGYLQTHIRRIHFYLHRLAWLYVTGEWPNGVIDHINHDRSDNRFSNLRVATISGNMANRQMSARKLAAHGFKGVYLDARRGLWCARVWKKQKATHVGYFKTAEEAARAHDEAAISMYGEFAILNFSRVRTS